MDTKPDLRLVDPTEKAINYRVTWEYKTVNGYPVPDEKQLANELAMVERFLLANPGFDEMAYTHLELLGMALINGN